MEPSSFCLLRPFPLKYQFLGSTLSEVDLERFLVNISKENAKQHVIVRTI